jgi:hypothetical protein
MEYLGMKKIGLVLALVVSSLVSAPALAEAGVTWSVESPADSYNPPNLNTNFDLTSVSAAIFDNDTEFVNFYANFQYAPKLSQFNDGRGSWMAIFMDLNLDGKAEYQLSFEGDLKGDLTAIKGYAYNMITKEDSPCNVGVFTNINAGKKWVGFEVSRICLGMPRQFNIRAYADYLSDDDKSFDYAPDSQFKIFFPGDPFTGDYTGTTSQPAVSSFKLPNVLQNTSTQAVNFTQPPANLTNLTEKLKPAIVTVKCAQGSGSGFSARVEMSADLKSAGFNSYVITNHHVIADCLGTKKVILVLNDKTTTEGTIVAWSQSKDIASIATKQVLETVEWIGSAPKQGWWAGVIGSPLGQAGILTTGIVSSINQQSSTFTLTAPINPGNSGGPVFDSTGRVIGLATSKNLTSSGQLAEGFGNAQGTPLMCATLVNCTVEPNPWGATARFLESDSIAAAVAAEKAAADKAAADKAAADKAAADKAAADKAAADKAAADKAAADKAAADKAAAAKAAADKLAAELRLKQEADARLLSAAQTKCLNYNGDLRNLEFKISMALSDFPLSKTKFQNLLDLFPSQLDCGYIELSSFDATYNNEVRLIATVTSSYEAALKEAKILATAKKTITCVKGKLTKKVTAVNPKCPTGYKKK